MSDDDDDSKRERGGIYDDVDTVPPPAGEPDPYSAATRVGSMETAVLQAMKDATRTGNPLKPPALPSIPVPPGPVAELEEVDGVPVLHDDLVARGHTEVYVPATPTLAPRSMPPAVPSRRRTWLVAGALVAVVIVAWLLAHAR